MTPQHLSALKNLAKNPPGNFKCYKWNRWWLWTAGSFMACYEIAVQVDTMSRERWEQIRKQINYVEYVAIPQQDINVLIAGPSTENRWVHKQAVEEGLLPQAVSRSELYMHMHAVVWMRLFEFTPALKKIKSDKGLVYINAWMCVNQTGTSSVMTSPLWYFVLSGSV